MDLFLKFYLCINQRNLLECLCSSVPLVALAAHLFSVNPVMQLMPSHHQLAAISPEMKIIPSIPAKQPSDAASVSADTMMNSWKHSSHEKEVVFLPDISQPEDGELFPHQQCWMWCESCPVVLLTLF